MATSAQADAAVRRVRRAFARAVLDAGAAGVDRDLAALVKALRGLSPRDAERVARGLSAGIVRSIASEVSGRVRLAARAGARAAQESLRLSLGASVAAEGASATAAAERAARAILAAGPDGLSLSARLHGTAGAYRRQMVRVLAQAQADAVGAREAARRLVDDVLVRGQAVHPDVIRDVERRIRRMANGGGPRAVQAASDAADAVARHAARLSEAAGKRGLGMRPAVEHAAEQIQRAIQRGDTEAAERAVRWWAHDKMRYQALVVARTESVRAYGAAFVERSRDVPGVTGLVWHTTGDDRVCPICEERDGQTFEIEDADGLLPAHPSCRCYWTHAIDRRQALREIVGSALA